MAIYRYRLCFSKEKEMKYISHLDLQRVFTRALRRGAIPVAFSQGFNPQPRLVFAAPLAVGLEGKNEYLDLYLTSCWEKEVLKQVLQEQLPGGLAIKTITFVDLSAEPLSALVEAALYVALFPSFSEQYVLTVADILQAKEIVAVRTGKKERKVDIRPFIYSLKIKNDSGGAQLFMLLAAGSKGGARPEEVLSLFPGGKETAKVFRENIFLRNGETLLTPAGETYEEYLQKVQLSLPA